MSAPIRLPDGSVPPSSFPVASSAERSQLLFDRTFNNVTLRRGYVAGRHLPGSKGYEGRLYTCYEVLVYQVNGEFGETCDRLHDVQIMVPLGSSADQYHASIRCPANHNSNVVTPELVEQSSRVVVACIDGRSDQGLIIGFIQHPGGQIDLKENGHYEFRSFNGMEFIVNSDGEYTIQYTGATIDDATNKVTEPDPEKAGSYVKFDKNGNIIISDDKGETITVSKKDKKIIVEAREQNETVTEKNWTVDVQKGGITINAKQDVIINSSANVKIGSANAKEHLMLGDSNLDAMAELLDIFLKNSASFSLPVIPYQQVVLNPKVVLDLAQWRAKYAIPSTSPLLAKKKFTE